MGIKFSDIFNSNDININNPKIEEVLNKTKDVAEAVGKKSAERLEISRKKVEILDAKAKASRLYEKLGEIYYNSLKSEAPDLENVDDIAAKISQLQDKIDTLSVEIEEAKAQFNDTVSDMTRKTKNVIHREFDKTNKREVTVDAVDTVDAEVSE